MHRLSEVDPEKRRALCSVCGPVDLRAKGGRWRCATQAREYARQHRAEHPCTEEEMAAFRERIKQYNGVRHRGKSRYRKLVVLDCCERCGYVPEDLDEPVELDVHHRDGDHKNNAPENLEILCANCHRVITHEMRKKARRSPSRL